MFDIYSRKIVGHEVHEANSAMSAAQLMRWASLAEGLVPTTGTASDNGSAMKDLTMLTHLSNSGRGIVQQTACEQR